MIIPTEKDKKALSKHLWSVFEGAKIVESVSYDPVIAYLYRLAYFVSVNLLLLSPRMLLVYFLMKTRSDYSLLIAPSMAEECEKAMSHYSVGSVPYLSAKILLDKTNKYVTDGLTILLELTEKFNNKE